MGRAAAVCAVPLIRIKDTLWTVCFGCPKPTSQAGASVADRNAMRATTFGAYHKLKRKEVADMKRGVKPQRGQRRSTQSRKTSWLLGTAKYPPHRDS